MADQTVIKFNRNGDPETGLTLWDSLPPELIVSGDPIQNGHQYFATFGDSVTSGVWDSTDYFETRAPYSVDEYMVLLEGSLDIEQADGQKLHFVAGDSFVIPKGAVVQWQQHEYLRKFYMIYESEGEAEASDQQAMLLDVNEDLPRVPQKDASLYLSDLPDMGMRVSYQSADKKFIAGVWECGPMKRVPATIERSELMHILEGSGSITNADGVVFHFEAGDTFMVPVGMGYQWQSDQQVKKTFCSFTP
ncbi:MAG: putative cupin superfamily protein [Gammaproteobacteria bacterium]|jgi:uncharacterized cupin superfamily protein